MSAAEFDEHEFVGCVCVCVCLCCVRAVDATSQPAADVSMLTRLLAGRTGFARLRCRRPPRTVHLRAQCCVARCADRRTMRQFSPLALRPGASVCARAGDSDAASPTDRPTDRPTATATAF